MNTFLKTLLSLSLSGSLLILILTLLRPIYKDYLGKKWQYYIWLVVIVRLIIPIAPETNLVGALFQKVDNIVSQSEQQNGPLTMQDNLLQDSDKYAEQNSLSKNQEAAVISNTALTIFTYVSKNLWIGWLVIFLMLMVRKITLYQSFVKFVRAGSTEVADIDLLEQLGQILEKHRVKKAVELYTNSLIPSPVLIGFFHPCIILPSINLPASEFQFIVTHEIIHYKRLDMFYKWSIQFVICLHWFNPLVHFMGRSVARACELACDEAVITPLSPQEQRSYGNTLINAIEAGGSYKNPVTSMALNESWELLEERLGAIMKFKKSSKLVYTVTLVLTVVLLTGATALGVYAAPEKSATQVTPSPEDIVSAFKSQSYYRDFYARKVQEQYEISGTLYQNTFPRSLVRFEKSGDTKLIVEGTITPIEGEIILVYKDQDGTLTTLAEGTTETNESVSVSYEIETSEKGEFYFESESAICEFDLKFSDANKISYYLTNENPLGLTY